MTLTSQIITDAYRRSNLIPIGTVPNASQHSEGIKYLNRIVASTIGNEVSENFQAFPLGSNNIQRPAGFPWYGNTPDGAYWFVPKNVRLTCNLTAAAVVWLDPVPNDGTRLGILDNSKNFATRPLTVMGNGQQIDGVNSITLNTNGFDQQWMYRADLGNWQKVLPLLSTDEFPFPIDFDDYFVDMLAVRLNPSYGQAADEQLVLSLRRGRTQIKARYRQSVQVGSENGLVYLPQTTFDRYYWPNNGYGNPTQIFLKGVPWS